MKHTKISSAASWLILFFLTAATAFAQTTAFTYQGRLTDAGLPPSANYDFEFRLIDAGGGIITVRFIPNVPVVNGVFNIPLDFGAGVFQGEPRSLEIAVRPAGGGGFTTLNPRQPILSSPYAIRSLISASADNATRLGGIDSARFVQQDAGANVSIGGNLSVAGTATYNTVNAQTQYNLGGQRILSGPGIGNLFAGISAGASNTTGINNSFFGRFAGQYNTSGGANSFFGTSAGLNNTDGDNNTYVGSGAGIVNETGDSNTFVGVAAGFNNRASFNTFTGANAGSSNTTGYDNAFFGSGAGIANTVGYENSFFGKSAGLQNTSGIQNSFFGINAGINNTTGSYNTFSGAAAGTANQTGIYNTFVGRYSGLINTSGSSNTFIGSTAGENNSTGNFNTFVGVAAGGGTCSVAPCAATLTGSSNSFFGAGAGETNANGAGNSFFGASAGANNSSGFQNAFFGINAGLSNADGSFNSFFGNNAGYNNTSGTSNNFVGGSAGGENTTGGGNSFFGDRAGNQGIGNASTTGSGNTFIGVLSGKSIISGSSNTMLGGNTSGTAAINFAVAIGANASVTQSNSIVLGAINGINGAIADTNVGIGTTAPQTRLQIKTAPGNFGFTQTDGAITVGSYVGVTSLGATGGWLGTLSNNKLFFFSNSGQPSMTVDTTGNVGIGNSAPGSKLTVAGLIETTTGGVKFPDGTIQTTASNLTPASVILNQTTPQASANFNIAGNGTVGGTLTANTAQVTGNGFVLGNFGIGTAAPRAKLDVTGGNILIDTPGTGIILKSPDATACRLLKVDNAGAIVLSPVVCP